jgi:hypothetical protein
MFRSARLSFGLFLLVMKVLLATRSFVVALMSFVGWGISLLVLYRMNLLLFLRSIVQ